VADLPTTYPYARLPPGHHLLTELFGPQSEADNEALAVGIEHADITSTPQQAVPPLGNPEGGQPATDGMPSTRAKGCVTSLTLARW
jgi:hypothetical protein